MTKLCFMYACDKKYADFIVPFVYFSSIDNKDACYEFLLTEKIDEKTRESIDTLSKLLDRKIVLREFNWKVDAKHLRFVETPQSEAEYAYIGDIDIFILEDILPFHIEQMKKNSLCYDNVQRLSNPKCMSGLQLCRKDYFSKTASARRKHYGDAKHNEVMLMEILKESGLKIVKPKDFDKARPVHGIHVSLNCEPFKNNDVLFWCETRYAQRFLQLIDEDFYKEKITPLLSEEFIKILDAVMPFIKRFTEA